MLAGPAGKPNGLERLTIPARPFVVRRAPPMMTSARGATGSGRACGSPPWRTMVTRSVFGLAALVAAALLMPADASAQRGGFGGGFRPGGEGFASMGVAGGGFRGSHGGHRSARSGGHTFRHHGGHTFRHQGGHRFPPTFRHQARVSHGVRHGHHGRFFPHHRPSFSRHPAFFRHDWGKGRRHWAG
jgi:hypothetical protein